VSWKACERTAFARVEPWRLTINKGLLELLGDGLYKLYADREEGRLALVLDPKGKPVRVYKHYAGLSAGSAIMDLELSIGDRLDYVETTEIDGKKAFVLEVPVA
jgi:hypothetical protein